MHLTSWISVFSRDWRGLGGTCSINCGGVLSIRMNNLKGVLIGILDLAEETKCCWKTFHYFLSDAALHLVSSAFFGKQSKMSRSDLFFFPFCKMRGIFRFEPFMTITFLKLWYSKHVIRFFLLFYFRRCKIIFVVQNNLHYTTVGKTVGK